MPGEDTRFKPGFDPRRPQHRRGHSRNKLTTKFLEAICEDFEQHGAKAIEDARAQDPLGYVKVVASIVPKELEIKRPLEDLSDDELTAGIAFLRSRLAEATGSGETDTGESAPTH